MGQAPADLHPPLNKKGGLEGIDKRVGNRGKKSKRPTHLVGESIVSIDL